MAVLTSVVNVNNGNTGWTKKDFIDALETVFANLGFHGGSNYNGVVQCMYSPSSYEVASPSTMFYNGAASGSTSWKRLGGSAASNNTRKTRYFYVTNDGTTAYRILEQFVFTSTSSSGVNLTDNAINVTRHGLSTGDVVVWAPGETNANYNIAGLTLNTEYYIIADTANRFKLAANATDATNGVAIDLTGYATTNGAVFRRKSTSAYNNYTLTVLGGDILTFVVDPSAAGTFNLCGNVNSYTADRKLDAAAFAGVSYQDQPTGNGTTTITWDTSGWRQTETEPLTIPELQNPGALTGLGIDGTIKYIYANDTHSGMKGEIVIQPWLVNDTYFWKRYWKYTVPASGGRSELKLRVWRQPTYADPCYVVGITIHNQATGWQTGDSFVIPGDQIGGTSPANDITIGINTNETSSGLGNGIGSVGITTVGAGSNFYQKHFNGQFAVLKNVNDAGKTFGTTYYTFGTHVDNDSYMNISSGSGWNWLNVAGTNYGSSSYGTQDLGFYTGYSGLDFQGSYNYISRDNDLNAWPGRIQYASTATPTAYPLSIRVYRAQAPQDSNFAIIQFTQTINGSIVPYGTLSIHKGASFGSSVFDLNHVFLDSWTVYGPSGRSIFTSFKSPGYRYGYNAREPVNSNSIARAASYGWMRQEQNYYVDRDGFLTYYSCNIDTNNNTGSYSEMITYYRNSTYDRNGGVSVNSLANYYKPIKGLPIEPKILPCPYYIPDDFVMLQVATTPGLAAFRPGDTVTISPSEVYEIILAGYQNNINGLDNIDNNNTIGMLFMARTT